MLPVFPQSSDIRMITSGYGAFPQTAVITLSLP